MGNPDLFPPPIINRDPGTIPSPCVKIIADGTGGWNFGGEAAPLAAGARLIQQCIDHPPQINRTWTSAIVAILRTALGHERFNHRPLHIS